ncbi:MAG: zf-TFIIB domain-containing protein [Pseudoxanthomonas sp.]
MQCPKCSNAMNEVPDLPAKAFRCSHCNGVWFEMLAHEQLVEFAARIDTGSAEQGQEYNRIDRIDCPVCEGRQDLIRMVDPQQPHIWFESCQNCFGRFYDAGEFTDFTEHSFMEWLKDLDAPARPL